MSVGEKIEAIYHMGYCLWIGAGVTHHLSSLGIPSPGWGALVSRMEGEAGFSVSRGAFPDRLARCWRKLGLARFQALLRGAVHETLAEAGLAWAEARPAEVPRQAYELVTLGRGANVIVNFNVEIGTSRLIGGGIGKYVIKAYESPLMTHVVGKDIFWAGAGGGAPRLSIFHPHGAVEAGGLCVLTAEDYRVMNGTLALQLATHVAFREKLVIVGMSLDDVYLRHQLTTFREQIGEILWIRSDSDHRDDEVDTWADDVGVTTVSDRSWDEAWASIAAAINSPRRPSERLMLDAWAQFLSWACGNDRHSHPAPMDVARGVLHAARGHDGYDAPFSRVHPRWASTGEVVLNRMRALPIAGT